MANNSYSGARGSPHWMSPESIRCKNVSFSTDIWSLGCTVIEMLTTFPPFHDLNIMTAMFKIGSKEIQIPEVDKGSKLANEFIQLCMQL
eukprot:Pgem_evm1s13212